MQIQKNHTATENQLQQLCTSTQLVSDLSSLHQDEMFNLFCKNYNQVSKKQFLKDLSKKDEVILLTDEFDAIQGFSTLAFFKHNFENRIINILFSGDTIINPEYWGSQALVLEFSRVVGRLLRQDPHQTWYWFLISKGHRTYMYLPLYFSKYYPGLADKNAPELKPILDSVASKLFGEFYHADTDLIIFPSSLGELKPELAEGSFKRQRNRQVSFFLSKNPNFHKGQELACFIQLSRENLNPRIHPYLDL